MIESALVDLPHGITLSCRTCGDKGRPVLMFLHGFPEAAFVWDALMIHFSKPEHGGFRCVAPNLRGFEHSSAPADVKDYRLKHLMQDIAALIAIQCNNQPLACLVAHDWGGAVAWNLAAARPELMKKLAIINSPHPGTFLRELTCSAGQQDASAYMNFLIRPDAEDLLAEDDFRRLWALFNNMGATDGPHRWLTGPVQSQYRAVWQQGLHGALNYYRASPVRPPRSGDPAASAVHMPRNMLDIRVQTMVIWGMNDHALLPSLLEGLDDYVPDMTLHRVSDATHWIVHEQPDRVAAYLQDFLTRETSR